MTEIHSNNPDFQASLETQQLVARLSKLEVGETISYLGLNEVISGDVQNGSRGYLTSARRALRRDRQIIFDVIRGVGLVRIDGAEIVNSTQRRIKRANKQAREGLKDLACVEYDQLAENERQSHNMQAAGLGMIELATSQKGKAKIQQLAVSQPDPPKLEDVAKLFTER